MLIPGRDLRESLLPELRREVAEVLRAIGITDQKISEELQAMEDAAVGRTANRRVLGSMNDFAYMAGFHQREGMSLREIALQLAKAPCSPLGMDNPRDATAELFAKVLPSRNLQTNHFERRDKRRVAATPLNPWILHRFSILRAVRVPTFDPEGLDPSR